MFPKFITIKSRQMCLYCVIAADFVISPLVWTPMNLRQSKKKNTPYFFDNPYMLFTSNINIIA